MLDLLLQPGPVRKFAIGAVIFIVGTLGILIAVGIYNGRQEAYRMRSMQCGHNLQIIARALAIYESQYRALPPAYIADKSGKRLHSWRVLLLPFLDESALYRQYRFDEPWNGPNNRKLMQEAPIWYRCPLAETLSNPGETNYVVVVGRNTAFPGAKSLRYTDVEDGLSNTLAVVETIRSGINWLEPRDFDFESMSFRVNDPDRPCISGNHHHGYAGVAVLDGCVRFFSATTDPALIKTLLDCHDGPPMASTPDWY